MTIDPEQFNKIALKEDLVDLVTRDEMNSKFGEVLTAIDGLAKLVKNNETERLSNIVAHDRFETRIGRVEKQLDLNPIAG